ncbi:hypothetical protein SDC9_71928 [bioreactor metagenome]|uniref:Uncharacterized protein n=1 Tax=bioreactor metagenome TaxID=1076179 RepID=A0A644YH42_9ZZZZ
MSAAADDLSDAAEALSDVAEAFSDAAEALSDDVESSLSFMTIKFPLPKESLSILILASVK